MSRVRTNFTAAAYAFESSQAVLPGSPVWKSIEPNSYEKFGNEYGKVARNPISKNRQRRKGLLTSLTSGIEVSQDLTLETLADFTSAFLFARATGQTSPGPVALYAGASFNTLASNGTAYTHAALAAAIPAGRLVYGRGWGTAGNNGLKLVTAGGTTTTTPASGLASETPTQVSHASIQVAGVQGATGDIELDANGDLISTVLDFTTLGLTVGQFIKLGGSTSGTQFATAAYNGTARISGTITANLIPLDTHSWTVGAADDGATKTIQVLFGQFVRNVAVDHADFLEQYIQFELVLAGLQNPGPGDEYEYSTGNLANELSGNLPLQNKAEVSVAFVGLNTEDPTTTRKTNAASPVQPVQVAGFSTSTDIARLGVAELDGTELTTYFKQFDFVVKNSVAGEFALGNLAAVFMNVGNLEVDVESTVIFTDSRVTAAIRANETLNVLWQLKNGDGGVIFNMPSCEPGDGAKEFPLNQSVLLNLSLGGFGDPNQVFGFTLGVSFFPYLPA